MSLDTFHKTNTSYYLLKGTLLVLLAPLGVAVVVVVVTHSNVCTCRFATLYNQAPPRLCSPSCEDVLGKRGDLSLYLHLGR